MKKKLFGIITFIILAFTLLTACSTSDSLTDEQKQALIDTAIELQNEKGQTSADDFDVTQLKKGDRIYGLLPGQDAFYISQATIEEAEDSYVKLYELLQMTPSKQGYSTELATYEIQEDTWVAVGQCLTNTEINEEYTGTGGGTLFVIPNFKTQLKHMETMDLHN